MKVGYISRVLPSISETFVLREMESLEKLGINIVPFSVHAPSEDQIHPESRTVFEQVNVVTQPRKVMFWLSHLKYLCLHPVRYFSTLWQNVITNGENLKNKFRALSQFFISPHAAHLLEKNEVSHLHAHFANIPSGVAMMGSALAGISFSFTIHSYGLFVDKMLLNKKLQAAAFVATVSNYNQKYIRKNYPDASQTPLHVVRCGVDPDTFKTVEHRPVDSPLILSVGRLVELKGFHTLISACSILRDKGISFRCKIVGEGPEENNLKKMIREHNLDAHVELTGKLLQHELIQLYQKTALFTLPSCIRQYQDNVPVVLIEALAMEIPTISTRITGIPEVVVHEKTGLLIEPDNETELAAAIERLLLNPDEALIFARAGRQHIIETFNIFKSAERLKTLFAEVDSKHGKL